MLLSLRHTKAFIAPAFATLLLLSCTKENVFHPKKTPDEKLTQESASVMQASGTDAIVFLASDDAAAILPIVSDFRNTLGTLNTAPGATGGRREINWDAVPAALTNTNNFPGDFFSSSNPALPNGRKRGLLLVSQGAGSFRVDGSNFTEFNPSFASRFTTFSPTKLFSAIGSSMTECNFKVPGTNTNASVQGFGVVFCDVSQANSTSIEYFSATKSLGIYKAPTSAMGQLSFVGVYFPGEKVTSVKINAGNGFLKAGQLSTDGNNDLVVMDDFIYSEPTQ